MKLTIDQLKNYLGTGLKVYIDEYGEGDEELIGIIGDEIQTNVDAAEIDLVRPICYRLSDLDKLIPGLGFVPLKRLVNDNPKVDNTIEIEFKERKIKSLSSFDVTAWIDYESGESRKEHLITFYPFGSQGITPFRFMENLFQWHFWPFGDEYFEAGLVIDKLKMTKK